MRESGITEVERSARLSDRKEERPGVAPEVPPRRRPWDKVLTRNVEAWRGDTIMAHTYTNLLMHTLFGTQDRRPLCPPRTQAETVRLQGRDHDRPEGQARAHQRPEDHVHFLSVLPASHSLCDLMEKLKANSSQWVHEHWPRRRSFGWQTGYTGFSVEPGEGPTIHRREGRESAR